MRGSPVRVRPLAPLKHQATGHFPLGGLLVFGVVSGNSTQSRPTQIALASEVLSLPGFINALRHRWAVGPSRQQKRSQKQIIRALGAQRLTGQQQVFAGRCCSLGAPWKIAHKKLGGTAFATPPYKTLGFFCLNLLLPKRTSCQSARSKKPGMSGRHRCRTASRASPPSMT